MKLIGGGRLSFKEFARRLYRAYQDDLLFDSAAQLSYYFLFSLFPFLFFLASLTAYLPLASLVDRLVPQLRLLAPSQVSTFVEEHLRALTGEQRPRLLIFSLVAAVFAASRGIDAIRRALNLAYDVKESRPLWRTELWAIGLTVAGATSVMCGLALLVAGGDVGFWVAERMHVERVYVLVVQQLRWPVTGLLIASLVAVAYHILPDVKQDMKFLIPGSVTATVLWLLATWGFGQYVSAFNTYNVTYGSLGGMVVLLVWLYLSGLLFVLGGTINAILEHASATGKAQGARAPGEIPPPEAERPSAVPPGVAASATVAARSSHEHHGPAKVD
jgi:membrane protein